MATNGTGLIQALGVGSGLDINSLVSQLVQAEGAPSQSRLTRQATAVATQLSAVGSLRGALASFQSALTPLKSAALFDVLSATSADNDIFTASADSDAVAGSYEVEVQQMARGDQLVSTPFIGGATSVVGTGTLTLNLGTSSFVIDISDTNNTLAGIRDAINTASGNPGIQATLVYGQSGAQLVLSATKTGATNTIRVTASGGDGGLAALTYDGTPDVNYAVKQEAQDAIVLIAGVEHHSASNVIDGAIDGVAITLKDENLGSTVRLTVAADTAAVKTNVQRFVAAYNAMHATLAALSSYNPATKAAGPMLGDAMLNGLESQLRTISTAAVPGLSGTYTSLAAIGITTDANGKLAINDAKLQAALDSGRGAVANVFGGSTGIAKRLDDTLTTQLGSAGSIAARDRTLKQSQDSIEDDQLRLSARLELIQQRYLAQFTALDTLMSQLNSTSSFLTQQLANSNAIVNSGLKSD